MPPSSDTPPPPQNDTFKKYRFHYSGFIVGAIITSIVLFFVFVLTVFVMYGQYSSNHTFDKQFYDSCMKERTMEYLFQLRQDICDAQSVLKELQNVELDKVGNTLLQAIREEISMKTMDFDGKTSACEYEEYHRKTCYTIKIKNAMKDSNENVQLIFYIYVPISTALLIGIFVAFWKAESLDLTIDQKKSFKIFAIFFACHAFIHILILYSIIYDNNHNFKANEIPSFCTKDILYLTEECYNNDAGCVEMFAVPQNGALTFVNYLFWQILLFVICMVLMAFGEGRRSTARDGYEAV